VRHEVLIALGDPGEALDRAAVEPRPVADRALELVDRDRDRLDEPEDIRELELDEPDAGGFRGFDRLGSVHLLAGDDHQSGLLDPIPDLTAAPRGLVRIARLSVARRGVVRIPRGTGSVKVADPCASYSSCTSRSARASGNRSSGSASRHPVASSIRRT